jgi:hypothetical protein
MGQQATSRGGRDCYCIWSTSTGKLLALMARIQKRQAEKYDDGDLALNAIELQWRALEPIKLHLPEELPEVEKPAE